MNEDEKPRYVTNRELKEELDKRPTKYEVLFYIVAATAVGRVLPADPVKPAVGAIWQWLF